MIHDHCPLVYKCIQDDRFIPRIVTEKKTIKNPFDVTEVTEVGRISIVLCCFNTKPHSGITLPYSTLQEVRKIEYSCRYGSRSSTVHILSLYLNGNNLYLSLNVKC